MKGSHGYPEQETLYPHYLIGSWERIRVDIHVRTFKEAIIQVVQYLTDLLFSFEMQLDPMFWKSYFFIVDNLI